MIVIFGERFHQAVLISHAKVYLWPTLFQLNAGATIGAEGGVRVRGEVTVAAEAADPHDSALHVLFGARAVVASTVACNCIAHADLSRHELLISCFYARANTFRWAV